MNNSLSWSIELATYCFIWLIFIGISYAMKVGRHIKIDILYLKLTEKSKSIIDLIVSIILLLFLSFIMIRGLLVTITIFSLNTSSPALQIPVWTVYAALPCGIGMTIVRVFQALIANIKKN